MDWSAALKSIEQKGVIPSLEEILTGKDYFGLTTATPLQRALCRAVEGVPLGDLTTHPHVLEAMGDISVIDGVRPLEVVICAGIRSGKSLFNGALLVWSALAVDCATLRPGEIPRGNIVSVQKLSAAETLNHAVQGCLNSPILKKLYQRGKDDTHFIIQPHTGRKMQMMVVANAKEGASLVSAWSFCTILDEAGRMGSEADGVINYEAARNAVQARILKGGTLISTSSPTAPYGGFYKAVTAGIHKPSPEMLVIQAQGPWLNPYKWTPEEVEKVRRVNPDVYNTDVMAKFSSPEASMFPLPAVEACTREADICPPEPGLHYVAAIDPALRSNGFTLVIGTRKGNKRIVAFAKEWRAPRSEVLNSLETMKQVAECIAPYGVTMVASDQWCNLILQERARECGFTLYQWKANQEDRSKIYTAVQAKMADGLVEIPPNDLLRMDLLRTRKEPLQGGGYTIKLPKTQDGRHGDFVPPVMIALGNFCMDKDDDTTILSPGQQIAAKMKAERMQEVKRSNIKKGKARWRI